MPIRAIRVVPAELSFETVLLLINPPGSPVQPEGLKDRSRVGGCNRGAPWRAVIDNLTNVDYAVSTDIRMQYDPLNRLTKMVDAAGTTRFTYTPAGLLLTEDGPFASDILTNLYSNRLRTRLSLQQPTGLWTNAFGYDAAKRLTNVTSPAGTFGYLYLAPRCELPARLTLSTGI